MRKAFPVAVFFLAAILSAWAGTPIPLSTVGAVRSLPLSEAGRGLPVSFEATVTFYRDAGRGLFVQDENGVGVFVKTPGSTQLTPGDRVQVKGKTDWGYRPSVVASQVTVLGHGKLPNPIEARFDRLISGELDSRLVKVHGIIHAADMNMPSAASDAEATLRVYLQGGYLDARLLKADPRALDSLLDATVEITGVAGGKFDGKMELTGLVLHVSSLAEVKVLKRAATSPWSKPLTPIDEILNAYDVNYNTRRVTVTGTVTFFEPGSAVVLQNAEKSLWVRTDSFAPMHIGDRVLATGFPGTTNGFLVLTSGEIRDSGVSQPIRPVPLEWEQVALSRHLLDLVSIEGNVVTDVRESEQDEYVVVSGGHIFSAIYPHAIAAGSLAPMPLILPGSRVRITGICASDYANPFGQDAPFNVLLRAPEDVEVLSKPSPLTVHNLSIVMVGLLLVILLLVARVWYIDRSRRTELAELGYLSLRRAEILEDINNSRPLNEVLERITELASVSLKGAPCWCEMVDGFKLGNRPPQLGAPGLRIANHVIGSHAKHAHGALFAAFDARTIPQTDEDRALALAAELATLAVENSKFHSELLHRSEFDMLTAIQNRFSFEKQLDERIESARRSSGRFGLIYIDLNGFKRVNDVHGHQVGDSFLQHVAERMKHQLRPGDVLARMGGDEFAVLVRVVRDRAEVEDITSRLAQCFEEPIQIDRLVLHGSASFGIAIYPTDAITKDEMLSIADAAMYVEKHTRRRSDSEPAGGDENVVEQRSAE